MKNDNLPRMWAKANRTSSFDRKNVVRIGWVTPFQLMRVFNLFCFYIDFRVLFVYFYHESSWSNRSASQNPLLKWSNRIGNQCETSSTGNAEAYNQSIYTVMLVQLNFYPFNNLWPVLDWLFKLLLGLFSFFFLFSLSVCLTSFIFSPLFYSPVFDLHRINVMMKNDCLKRVEFLVWLQFFVHLRRQRFHSLFA